MTLAERVIRAADSCLEANGWHQPPRLCLIDGRTDKPYLDDVPHFADMVAMGIRPPVAVSTIATWFADVPSLKAPPDWAYGWLLITEMWAVVGIDETSPVDRARLERIAAEGRLHEAPERQRVRMLFLASFSGQSVALARTKTNILYVLHDGEVAPDEGAISMSGAVPDAMRMLVEATRKR